MMSDRVSELHQQPPKERNIFDVTTEMLLSEREVEMQRERDLCERSLAICEQLEELDPSVAAFQRGCALAKLAQLDSESIGINDIRTFNDRFDPDGEYMGYLQDEFTMTADWQHLLPLLPTEGSGPVKLPAHWGLWGGYVVKRFDSKEWRFGLSSIYSFPPGWPDRRFCEPSTKWW